MTSERDLVKKFYNSVLASVLGEIANGARNGRVLQQGWAIYLEEAAERLNEEPGYKREDA